MSSSGLKPIRATPLRTPMVAGTPPFNRTTVSRSVARETFSGYGNPGLIMIQQVFCMGRI